MAKNPQFHLQPILNYKAGMVDTLEVQFARLKNIHKNEADALQKLQYIKQQGELALNQRQQEGEIDCQAIQLHQQYLRSLEQNLAQQAARVAASKSQMENKRTELIKTMQDQETLEKLREQERDEHQKDLLRREARTVDDLVITRHGQKR